MYCVFSCSDRTSFLPLLYIPSSCRNVKLSCSICKNMQAIVVPTRYF